MGFSGTDFKFQFIEQMDPDTVGRGLAPAVGKSDLDGRIFRSYGIICAFRHSILPLAKCAAGASPRPTVLRNSSLNSNLTHTALAMVFV